MPVVEPADYVLVARGRVLASSNDPQLLLNTFDLTTIPDARVKSWRLHTWVPGDPNTVHRTEHCQACKAIRQVKGRNDQSPCVYPERIDPDVTVITLDHEHREDVCCMEHHHHVSAGHPHVNCILR